MRLVYRKNRLIKIETRLEFQCIEASINLSINLNCFKKLENSNFNNWCSILNVYKSEKGINNIVWNSGLKISNKIV